MPEAQLSTWREELVVDIKGGEADRHEMSTEVLATSLLGFQKFAECVSKKVNGKSCKLNIKVKAGFFEGSFEYKIVLDFFGAVLPLVPQVVQTIREVMELRRFLNGERPANIERGDGQTSIVKNNSGNVLVVQNSTINLESNSSTSRAMKNFLNPLENGANNIKISSQEMDDLVITDEDKNAFLNISSDENSTQQIETFLEVLTAQMDGKPDGWRFYDVHDNFEFSAVVKDFDFLHSVNNGTYGFLRGRHVKATVVIERTIHNARKSTKRSIISIRPLSREEETELFG